MKTDDYLWDKSGAPDAETAKLERILGNLQYRPVKRDDLPAIFEAARHDNALATNWNSVEQRRTLLKFTPVLAIAATLLMALLAGALWLKLRATQTPVEAGAQIATAAPEATEPARSTPTTPLAVVYSENRPENVASNRNQDTSTPSTKVQRPHSTVAIAYPAPLTSGRDPKAHMTKAVMLIAEGERAKDQLVLALHIASAKLSLAQRSAQVNKDGVPAS